MQIYGVQEGSDWSDDVAPGNNYVYFTTSLVDAKHFVKTKYNVEVEIGGECETYDVDEDLGEMFVSLHIVDVVGL